ncbi:MAG: hypothetical protein JHC93_08640 [Parachlamydiales bacterium]|nr:hypothetical protein [Parachlamydiales bacterium]
MNPLNVNNSQNLKPQFLKIQKELSPIINLTDQQMMMMQTIKEREEVNALEFASGYYEKATDELPVSLHFCYDAENKTVQSFVVPNKTRLYPKAYVGSGSYKIVKIAHEMNTGDKFVSKHSYLFSFANKDDVDIDVIEKDDSFKTAKAEVDLQKKVYGDKFQVSHNVFIGKKVRLKMFGPRKPDLFDQEVVKFVSFEPIFSTTMFDYLKLTRARYDKGHFQNNDNVTAFQREVENKFVKILTCATKLHDLGYVHSDIKWENINWDDGLLIDFGLAESMDSYQIPTGTLETQAPLLCIYNNTDSPNIDLISQASKEAETGLCDAYSIAASFYPLVHGVEICPRSTHDMFFDFCKARCGIKPNAFEKSDPEDYSIPPRSQLWPAASTTLTRVLNAMIEPLPKNRMGVREALNQMKKSLE